MSQKPNYWDFKDRIEDWAENGDFPEIDCHKYVDFYKKFPLFQFSKITVLKNIHVPVEAIYGDNWAFQSKGERGHYPSATKLRSLLSGYTNVSNDYWTKEIPPVPIHKIFDKYYLDEGNHRLYLSKLLGRDTLLSDVYEYDYASLAKTSKLEVFGSDRYIILKNSSIYPVDGEEAKEFQSHKSLLSKGDI